MKGILSAHKYLVITLAMVVSLAFLSSAEALKIQFSSGATTITIQDDGIGDLTAGLGTVTFFGQVGNFTLNTSVGNTKPAPGFGTAEVPIMDLLSVNATSQTGGTLTVMITDTGYGPLKPGITGFKIKLGGETDGTVSVANYWDDTNAEFGTGHLITSMGPFTDDSFKQTDLKWGIPQVIPSPTNPNGNFSLTMIATITHNDGPDKSSSLNNKITPTPEPGTILLVGLGLLGLGIIGRRKMEA